LNAAAPCRWDSRWNSSSPAWRWTAVSESGYLAKTGQIVPSNHDPYAVGTWTHGINAELTGRCLSQIQCGLALRDVTGGHEKMYICLASQAELRGQIDLSPSDDLATISVDDGA